MSASAFSVSRLTVAAVACLALLGGAAPVAGAAPATDDQGYLDSTARCKQPDTAVAFGSTETSRVAICKTPDDQYEYRGVRVRDGATLLAPASRSGDGRFVAENDGITYTLTANSLVVSEGSQVIREEPMADFHELKTEPKTPKAPTASPTTPPLPPPLPAEVARFL
jgi:hypothetical protein